MQNVDFIVFDKATGVIEYVANGDPDAVLEQPGRGYLYGQKADSVTQFVNPETNSIESKREFHAGVWDGDEYVVYVPAGTLVVFQGQFYEPNNEALYVVVDQPGQYELLLINPLYIDRRELLENPRYQRAGGEENGLP